jgi:hypothetical protein
MIEQYLPNNNENSYRAILQKKFHLNQPNVAVRGAQQLAHKTPDPPHPLLGDLEYFAPVSVVNKIIF